MHHYTNHTNTKRILQCFDTVKIGQQKGYVPVSSGTTFPKFYFCTLA